MKVADALLRALYAVALLATAAGVTHLATVLVLPARAPDSLWERVRRGGAAVGATLTGPSLVDLGPDQDPALATALCRFDLRMGPLDVTLPIADVEFAVLTVLSRHGRVLGSVSSRAASGDRLALSVASAGVASAAPPARDVRIESPSTEGLVAAQVLFSTGSRRSAAEAAARELACRTGPRAGG